MADIVGLDRSVVINNPVPVAVVVVVVKRGRGREETNKNITTTPNPVMLCSSACATSKRSVTSETFLANFHFSWIFFPLTDARGHGEVHFKSSRATGEHVER